MRFKNFRTYDFRNWRKFLAKSESFHIGVKDVNFRNGESFQYGKRFCFDEKQASSPLPYVNTWSWDTEYLFSEIGISGRGVLFCSSGRSSLAARSFWKALTLGSWLTTVRGWTIELFLFWSFAKVKTDPNSTFFVKIRPFYHNLELSIKFPLETIFRVFQSNLNKNKQYLSHKRPKRLISRVNNRQKGLKNFQRSQ